MRTLVLLSILALTALASIPIQRKPDGLILGNPKAEFQLDCFFDLMCPDCQAANETLNQVLKALDFENQDKFRIAYHQSPNVFHIVAFPLSIIQHYIQDTYGNQAALDYQNLIFDYQADIPTTDSMTEFYNIMGNYIQTNMINYGITAKEIIKAFQSRDYDLAARASWKYGASKYVSGTARFYANGAMIDNNDGHWTFDQWASFFKQYTGLEVKTEPENVSFLSKKN